jgi:hypothetical protein
MQEWHLNTVRIHGTIEQGIKLTHGSNNLGLKTKLVLETTGKVGDTALAVACNVGDLADVVEHVATGEEEDSDQADGGPEVAALKDGKDVGSSNSESSDRAENGYGGGDDLDVVDRTRDGGSRASDMASEPGVDGLSGNDTRVWLARDWDRCRVSWSYPVVKSKRRG